MTTAPQFTVPLPARMRGLWRDRRGFVIPYFVAWVQDGVEVEPPLGEPDFRIVSPHRMALCIKHRRCWLCGQPLGRYLAFAIGPMCTISRVTMEPPGHYDCAAYGMRVCPFLTRPRMRRNDSDLPDGIWAPGITIERNPGVMAIWVARNYQPFKPEAGNAQGVLLRVGEPDRVEWWREGRQATRAEVMESITGGLPALREAADKSGTRRELEERDIPALDQYLPP